VTTYLAPGGEAELGPVYFTPSSQKHVRSWLFVRSNLTLLDEVLIHGEGGSGQLIFREPSGAQLKTLLMNVPEKNLRFCAGEGQQPVSKASSKKKGSKSEDEEPASDELQIKTQQAFVLANHGNLDVFVHGMRLGTCDKGSPTSEECACAFNGFVLPRCLRNATIRPGETLRVPVTFESDFSTSLARTNLIVISSAGPLTFELQAQLPHRLLPMCRAQLQLRSRPSDAEQRSRTVVTALLFIALVALGQVTLKEVRLNRSVTIRLVSGRHFMPAEALLSESPLSESGAPSTVEPLDESSPQGKPVPPARAVSSTDSEDGRDSPELHAAAKAGRALTNGTAAHVPLGPPEEAVPIEAVAVVPAVGRVAPPPSPELKAAPPPAKLAAVQAVPAAAKPKAASPAAQVAAAATQAVPPAPLEPAAPAPMPASAHASPAAAQTPTAPVAQLGVGPGPNAQAARARSKAAAEAQAAAQAEAAAAAEAEAEAPPGAPPPPAKPDLLHRTSSSSSARSVEAGEARKSRDASPARVANNVPLGRKAERTSRTKDKPEAAAAAAAAAALPPAQEPQAEAAKAEAAKAEAAKAEAEERARREAERQAERLRAKP
jgi:hypothetical protein